MLQHTDCQSDLVEEIKESWRFMTGMRHEHSQTNKHIHDNGLNIHTRTHAHAYTHMHTHRQTHTCIHTQAYTHAYVHINMCAAPICQRLMPCSNWVTEASSTQQTKWRLHVHTHRCTNADTQIHTSRDAHTEMHTQRCIYMKHLLNVDTQMHTHDTHIHTHTHLHTLLLNPN